MKHSILTGLCSVSFRNLQPLDIIKLVREAGLDGIEWACDCHCIPGQVSVAQEIGELTRKNGLRVISCGSYYYAGENKDFENILQTAAALQTNMIRIWPGYNWQHSSNVTEEYWQNVIKDVQRIADMAAEQNVNISFEYHEKMLTDTLETAIRLLNEVNRSNVYTYWQEAGRSADVNINELRTLMKMGKLTYIHINASNRNERQELCEKISDWKQYINEVRENASCEHALLLEFIKNDDPEQFKKDAFTLNDLLKN